MTGNGRTADDDDILMGVSHSQTAAQQAPEETASTMPEEDVPAGETGTAPSRMDAPADPDDLTKIKGIGPKIEGILHELGIYKFHQIATWTKAECDWVDGYLGFKGRIEQDNWVSQARTFAE